MIRRETVRKYLVCILVGVFAFSFVAIIRGYEAGAALTERLRVISDAFAVAATLLLSCGALVFLSDNGAFDMIGYTLKGLGRALFFGAANHESFYDYKKRRNEKERPHPAAMLLTGAVYLVLAVTFTVAFYYVSS